MTVQIIIEVPDHLGETLQRYQSRLPELLERGLHEIAAEESASSLTEAEIIETLAGQPTVDEVLAIHPTDELQARMTELLARSKESALSRQEQSELDRYLTLDHIVRLAKGFAYKQLASA